MTKLPFNIEFFVARLIELDDKYLIQAYEEMLMNAIRQQRRKRQSEIGPDKEQPQLESNKSNCDTTSDTEKVLEETEITTNIKANINKISSNTNPIKPPKGKEPIWRTSFVEENPTTSSHDNENLRSTPVTQKWKISRPAQKLREQVILDTIEESSSSRNQLHQVVVEPQRDPTSDQPISNRITQFPRSLPVTPTLTDPVEIKRYAQNRNQKNKNSFPICEHCNDVCYRSSRATKSVCQKNKLNLCYDCYEELELLDEFYNRRKCPNHPKCIAFESLTDRKRYNNTDFQEDYFRDFTKCLIHEDQILIVIPTEGSFCPICHEDQDPIKIHKNLEERKDYQKAREWACIWAASNYGRKDQLGRYTPEYRQACGAFKHIFYVPDGPALKKHKAWLKQIELDHKVEQEELERTLFNQLSMCPMPATEQQKFIDQIHDQWEIMRYWMGNETFKNINRKLICINCLEVFHNNHHYCEPAKILCGNCDKEFNRDRKPRAWDITDFEPHERPKWIIEYLRTNPHEDPYRETPQSPSTKKKKRPGQRIRKQMKLQEIQRELDQWEQERKNSYLWK